MLRRAGWLVNDKRVERIWRREGLKVPQKQPKRGRLWLADGSCIRLRAEHRNHVWSYDFVEDRTHNGRKLRMLNIIDEFTHECLEVPGDNAGTTFANQRAAYESLPSETKKRIDPLICRHHYGNRDDLDETSRTVASPLSAEQKAQVHWVRHPLVRTHAHTGRKALYAVSGSSFAIEGMDEREGVALLDELKEQATASQLCFTPEYEPGDVAIWDNCSVLHRAPLIASDRPRTLWRITVKEAQPTLPH